MIMAVGGPWAQPSWLVISEKLPLVVDPSAETAAMQTIAIKANMSAYSTSDAPRSPRSRTAVCSLVKVLVRTDIDWTPDGGIRSESHRLTIGAS